MTNAVEERVKRYYGSAETQAHYRELWGEGNIHFGYFPSLVDANSTTTRAIVKKTDDSSYEDGAEQLTYLMSRMGRINEHSRVVDLGCGYGRPLLTLHLQTGADCTGIDLCRENISICRQRACELLFDNMDEEKNKQHQRVRFSEGSFSSKSLMKDSSDTILKAGHFTHVFTQAAFCHAHDHLDQILQNCWNLLCDDGLLLINDMIGGDNDPDCVTLENVYQRMGFPLLLSLNEYCSMIINQGFMIEKVMRMDDHFLHSHRLLELKARDSGRIQLADNYARTCDSIKNGHYGMVFIVAVKKKHNTVMSLSKL